MAEVDWDTEELEDKEELIDSVLCLTPLDQWSSLNFCDIIQKRKKSGLSKISFDEDIAMWQNVIKRLKSYNDAEYREDIRKMDLNIPSTDVDLSELQGVYSRLVSYRIRVAEMTTIVNAQHEIFNKAYKTLKTSAMCLFPGTAKDKEASAEYLIEPFWMGTLSSKILFDYLIDIKEIIEFASINLVRILKEKEASAKINMTHFSDGASYNFQKEIDKEARDWDPDDIPTRKKVNS